MSTLDTLNKRLSMWKREKALRGNSRFDVDSAIEGIEDDIKKILDLGIEVSELAALRADLAQAQAERDAATRRAERAEAVAARFRDALKNSDPWTNYIPFNCVYCDAVYDGAAEYESALDRHNPGCVWVAAALACPEGGPR